MRIRFLSKGSADQISGGYLYNSYLLEQLREAGFDVAYHPTVTALRDVQATDIVIVDSLALAEAALPLLSIAAELVLLLHVVPDGKDLGPDGDALLEWLYRRSRVVVTGDSTLTVLRDRLADAGVDAVKIEPGVPQHWRAKQQYSDRAQLLLAVANYVPGKGIARLLDVLLSLRDLPWSLRVYGNRDFDSSYFDAVQSQLRDYALADRVELLGPVPHDAINHEMLQSDLLVHFSEYESYSMVTAEAIACGLPVLSYRTGNAEVFGRSGLVHYVEDGAAEAAALGALIDNRRSYEQLRRVGRREIRTWQDVGREFRAWLDKS